MECTNIKQELLNRRILKIQQAKQEYDDSVAALKVLEKTMPGLFSNGNGVLNKPKKYTYRKSKRREVTDASRIRLLISTLIDKEFTTKSLRESLPDLSTPSISAACVWLENKNLICRKGVILSSNAYPRPVIWTTSPGITPQDILQPLIKRRRSNESEGIERSTETDHGLCAQASTDPQAGC